MESESCIPLCDDGFNDFVHGRTAKQRKASLAAYQRDKLSSNITLEKPDGCETKSTKSGYDSDDNNETSALTINELLRSEGSGSENGMDAVKEDIPWYKNEKFLSSKCHLASIHSNSVREANEQKISTPTNYNWTTKRSSMDWRSQQMESFESNKEYMGSERGGSPLSCYSPSKNNSEYLGSPGKRASADWDDDDDDWERPTGERYPPLGAPNDDDQSIGSFEELGRVRSEAGRLKELEEEQEQLNSSLMSLTSHFAQVQFRLKQIVVADADAKEKLLQELEAFADRGIPDLRAIQQTRDSVQRAANNPNMVQQRELIERLKQQLDELEQYAYETGEAGLPQTELVHKQKVIIDQLKGKLPLDLEDLGRLTVEDLREQVDDCVKQMTG